MCRGCCCGTLRRLPDVDHDGIAAILEQESGPDAQVRQVDCLWACDRANVVVVNPAARARRAGARPAWITEVNTLERARAVAAWVRRGGPGAAEPPTELGDIHTAAELRKAGGW